MTDEVKKLIEETGRLVEEYKKTNDERLEKLENSGVEAADQKEKLEKMDERLNELDQIKENLRELETKAARPNMDGGKGDSAEDIDHCKAFVDWMRDPKNPKKQAELAEKGDAAMRKKEVSGSVAAEGGHAVPEIISRNIEQRVLEQSPMRQYAMVETVGSRDFKKLVDVRGESGGWVGEKDARTETNTPQLEEVSPTFGTVYGYPKATEESLNDIFFNVEAWISGTVGDQIADLESAAFVNGDGTNKPTGYLAGAAPVLAADGARTFGTLQYVASGVANAIDSHDPVIDLVASLKATYRTNARFFGNRTTKAVLRKLKDADGQYLWQPSLQAGMPDQYLGYQFVEDEKLADPTVANAFPLVFGDMRRAYMIADLVGLRATRDEITEPGYIKYYIRKRVGGILFHDEPLKLLKLEA